MTDRWVHSRPIWNQNAYSITNVEDNGAIPAHPEASWLRFNSFRQNAEPEGKALQAPDLTAKSDGGPVARTGCGPATLAVTVSNRGAQPMPRGVNVVFSAGSDATGPVVCQTTTTQRLLPGESEAVTCEWAAPPAAESLVYVQVDVEVSADGVRVNRNTECAEGNNWTVLEVPGCG